MEELKGKTLTEAEKDRNITELDYSGVGYGYHLKANYPKTLEQAKKDIETPELDRLEELVATMEAQ
jgi:hypothetical protein